MKVGQDLHLFQSCKGQEQWRHRRFVLDFASRCATGWQFLWRSCNSRSWQYWRFYGTRSLRSNWFDLSRVNKSNLYIFQSWSQANILKKTRTTGTTFSKYWSSFWRSCEDGVCKGQCFYFFWYPRDPILWKFPRSTNQLGGVLDFLSQSQFISTKGIRHHILETYHKCFTRPGFRHNYHYYFDHLKCCWSRYRFRIQIFVNRSEKNPS